MIALAASALVAACATPGPPSSAPSAAGPAAAAPANAQDLLGTWDVSLFFSPDAPPSKTVMVITAVDGGVVSGSFYGSPFQASRAIVRGGVVQFTAVTEDGSGPCATQGRLEDGAIEGTTFAIGRDFLMAWEALPMAETGPPDEAGL
ncbi:MAG: hypothetical protein AAF486_00050 [Pseudomonadota bacterium]